MLGRLSQCLLLSLCRPQPSQLLESTLFEGHDDSNCSTPPGSQLAVQSSHRSATVKESQWDPSIVRKLFDKEADNNHEEPLLMSQLAAQELRQAWQGAASDESAPALVAWVQAVAQVSLMHTVE